MNFGLRTGSSRQQLSISFLPNTERQVVGAKGKRGDHYGTNGSEICRGLDGSSTSVAIGKNEDDVRCFSSAAGPQSTMSAGASAVGP